MLCKTCYPSSFLGVKSLPESGLYSGATLLDPWIPPPGIKILLSFDIWPPLEAPMLAAGGYDDTYAGAIGKLVVTLFGLKLIVFIFIYDYAGGD